MSGLSIKTPEQLVKHILENRQGDRNLSITGVAKLARVHRDSIIRSGGIATPKLAEMLAAQGYSAGGLIKNGFDAIATWIVIEYFAFYATRTKAPGAREIAATFGATGVMTAFDNILNPEVPYIPQSITVEPEKPTTCLGCARHPNYAYLSSTRYKLRYHY